MIGSGLATRVYLAAGATDMRKGFDGKRFILRQSGRNRQTTVGSQESAASRIDGELLKNEQRPTT
jgi:hypothetical protein